MRKAIITIALTLCLTATAKADTAWVTAEEGLRLREKPSLEAEIIEVLPFGEKVSGITADGWMETQNGFLCADYLSDTDPTSDWIPMGEWRCTAYSWTGYRCANGEWPTAGYTIACNSLDFGTKVYISGIGFRTVCDRGPQWLGSEWCDVYMNSVGECIQWGSQTRSVWIIPTETEIP